MTLTALVAAYEGADGGLSATLPLAGVTLVEHQIRRLKVAGAERIVLLLEQWPPALATPLARLRADGIVVEPVTSLADAADRLAGASRVLLVADGCLPDQDLVDRVAAAAVPSFATLPDGPDREDYERIDAATRWAGLALIDGRRIAETAAMLGEWDPVSTMLRRIVQEGAARIEAGAEPPMIARSPAVLAAAEARLIAGSRGAARSWADRWIHRPIAEAALPYLFAWGAEPLWLGAAAVLLAFAGGIVAIEGWRWPALLLLLPAGPIAATGLRLGAVQARTLGWALPLLQGRRAGLLLAAIGLGGSLAVDGRQWGWLLLAVLLLGLMTALGIQRRILAWMGGGDEAPWLAAADALPWAMVPFAIAGAWGTGLAALGLYALASLAAVTRRLARIAAA